MMNKFSGFSQVQESAWGDLIGASNVRFAVTYISHLMHHIVDMGYYYSNGTFSGTDRVNISSNSYWEMQKD